MQLLWEKAAFLLDVLLRLRDMQPLHGREPLGIDLQRCVLAVPRLRKLETFSGVARSDPFKELIKGDPIHSRVLRLDTYPLDEERVIAAGKRKDERFLPFYDEAARVAKRESD